MREIKFHILKIDLHSFLYNEGRTILEIGIEDLVAIRHNPKNYLFIQYTGLKDKNGKEIYEGDVVKFEDGILEVCCDIWLCMGLLPVHGRGFLSFTDLAGKININELEIIGNIYENPELIKKGK